ncbi:MAG TPA: LysM peptidoglycan-binding domain-containing protein [Tepidisphaeraceae bacterium]|jgi:nucleoid-associated protein YgaU|nr:LysM peptidoglycan-binding domain-containing protein [Tepidisphaeraceae bacterium]
MLRKDVKVGLASGAVLLAVVIVYVSSINNPPTATKPVTTLDGRPPAPIDISTERAGGVRETRIVIGQNEDGRSAGVPTAVAAAPTEPDWSKLLEGGAPPALMTRTNGTTANQAATEQPPAGQPVDMFAESTPIGTEVSSTSTPDTGAATVSPVIMQETPTLSATATTPSATAAMALPPSPTVTRSAAPAGPREYTVKAGDSYYTIAREVYGDSHFYPHIQRANPDLVPTKIRAGMKINLPDPTTVKPNLNASLVNTATTGDVTSNRNASNRKTVVGPNEYRVQNDENLYRIAVKLYGTPKKMDEIYELNKAKIGNDPSKLKVGAVLKLPPGAKVSN